MEEKHRNILRRHQADIIMDLEPKNILAKLVKILNPKDEGEIKAQKTREERCDTLLEILPRKGPNAFEVFVEALQGESPHLALGLIAAEKGTEHELRYTRKQSAQRRGEIGKLKTELETEKQNRIETLQKLTELKSHHEISKAETLEQIKKLADLIQQLRDESSSRCEDLKDSARRGHQALENQELEKKSKYCQEESQPLQKHLKLLPWKLEPENEERQHKNGHSQVKYKELEDKVTISKSELKELLAEIIQQHRDETCSRCATLRNERDSTLKTEIQTLRKEIQEKNKGITKLSKDYQPSTQTPLKCHQSPQEKLGILPHEHNKEGKKKQQDEIKDLQKKNKRLLEDVEKSKEVASKLEKDLLKSRTDLKKLEKDLACENERVKEYQQKFEESEAKDYLAKYDLLQQKLTNYETHMSEENNSLREELKKERSKSGNLKKEVHRLRLTPKEMPGQIFTYNEDFDKRGVVYHLALYSLTSQVNPSSTQIVVTRSSDREGHAEDLLKERGTVSGTKDKEGSSWCVDLTEKYVLFLTHYTLRHGREKRLSVLLNWRLEGSLDGRAWTTLKNHKNDNGLDKDRRYCTCTWAINGNSNAFRYFRIFQTGKNSSGRFSIFLSGIELYGVLIEKSS